MQCSRCEEPAQTKTRGERFCAGCYFTFVSKKFRTAMSIFRVNGSLIVDRSSKGSELPMLNVYTSLGASSLVLIDLLVDMLEAQKKKNNGLTGFRINCIHIQPNDTPNNSKHPEKSADSENRLTGNDDWPWPQFPLQTVALPKINLPENASRSSRHDAQAVLIRQFAQRLAITNRSIAIFGYSMTKLSELTLSETVKGRGHLIPALISPDLAKDNMVYPLADITLPELREYCRLRGLDKYIVADPIIPGITKMQSIDEITRQYFADVQKGFPSIVSTVAKVASRLSQTPENCGFCQIGDNETTSLCYACRSSLGKSSLGTKLQILEQYEL